MKKRNIDDENFSKNNVQSILKEYAVRENKRTILKTLIYTGIIAFSFFIGGYYYNQKQDVILKEKTNIILELKQEQQALRRQNESLEETLKHSFSEKEYYSLKRKFEILNEQNQNLNKENGKLRILTKDYERRIQLLRKEKENLEEILYKKTDKEKKLLEETISLKENQHFLELENESLRKQNEVLKENYSSLLEENSIIKEEYSLILKENESLRKQNEVLKENYSSLEKKIILYEKETSNLKSQLEEKIKNNPEIQALYKIVSDLKNIFLEEKTLVQYRKNKWNIELYPDKGKVIIEYKYVFSPEKTYKKIILTKTGYTIYGTGIQEGLELAYESLLYALTKDNPNSKIE